MKNILLIKITFFIFLVYSIYKVMYPTTTTNLGDGYVYYNNVDGVRQHITNNQQYIVPEKVVEFDFDDNFIIATRIIVNIYKCCDKNVTECEGTNVVMFSSIYLKKLEYWLIDKKENIAYVSLDKNKIELKLQEFNSELKFDNDTYGDDTAMIMQSSENPLDKICVLENDPYESNILKKIIDLDNE